MVRNMDEPGKSKQCTRKVSVCYAQISVALERLDGFFEGANDYSSDEAAAANIGDWYAIAASITGLLSNPKGWDKFRFESVQRDITDLQNSLGPDFQHTSLLFEELKASITSLGSSC